MAEASLFSNIDLGIMQQFFVHCCASFGKYEERDLAMDELHGQLKKLKQLSKQKIHAKNLAKEIAELEDKINVALEKGSIIRHAFSQESYNKRLHNKIDELDKKLSLYLGHHSSRNQRIIEIERKIKGQPAKIRVNDEVLSKLSSLDVRLRRLGRHKKANKVKMQLLKEKIDSMKARFSE